MPPSESQIHREILEAIWAQTKQSPLSVLVMAAIVATVAMGKLSHALIVAWLLAIAALLLIRFVIIRRLMRLPLSASRDSLRIVSNISIASGSLHAASLLAFPVFSEAERALITILLLGLAVGTVATSLGYRRIFLSYSIPTIGGVALCWMFFPAAGVPVWTSYALSLLVIYLGIVLFLLANENFKRFAEQVTQRDKLAAALEQAEAANRAKTRFLASASHDLRQPLHTLSLFGAALQMRKLDDRSREIADQINTATRDLAFELDSLLDISKLDAGVVSVEKDAFVLNQMVGRLVDAYRPVAEEKSLSIGFDQGLPMTVLTDRVLLERIVRNLIDNAIKYTQMGGIKVALSGRAGPLAGHHSAVISVVDTGSGIPEDQYGLIFEEFYQVANQERDRSKGLGLGLSIVKRMAALLGVSIELESRIGQGTSFRVIIPVAAELVQARPAAAPAPVNSLSLAGLNIVVVDDEASIRSGMKASLELYGAAVSAFASIDAAMAGIADGGPVDALCVDLRLGTVATGIDAVNTVRTLRPGLPALVISGDTAPDRLREAKLAGLPLLHKPVQIESLIQELLKIVQSAAGEVNNLPASPRS